MAELGNYDTVVEKINTLYIKLIEKTEGIWERIYSYFQVGVWYARKTYYKKATLCFAHALSLLNDHKLHNNHKNNQGISSNTSLSSKKQSIGDSPAIQQSNTSALKADILFNLAQAKRATSAGDEVRQEESKREML